MAKQDSLIELFYAGVWNDRTAAVLDRDPITIARGRADEQQQPAPPTASLTFRGHEFNPANAASPLHGLIGRNTPIRISVGNDLRFEGEVATWTPRLPVDGADERVEVVAAGITRRLGQGADPLDDPLRRYLTKGDGATNLVGYWPMTAGGDSRTREAILGGPMRILNTVDQRDLRLVSADLAPWLSPGTTINGTVPPSTGLFPGQTVTAARFIHGATTEVTMDSVYRYTTGNLENRAGHQVKLFDSDNDFRVDYYVVNFNGLAVGSGGAEATNPDWRLTIRMGTLSDVDLYEQVDLDHHNELVDGLPHVIRVHMVLDAAADEIDWTVYVDGTVLTSGTATSVPLASFRMDQANIETNTIRPDALVFGPIAVWAGTPPAAADVAAAVMGHAGEHAGRRIERLCDEEGVPFVGDLNHDLDDTLPMGPQYPDGLVALLHEAAEVDQGMLVDGGWELNDAAALDYRPGRDLYNQDPALALDYQAKGVAPPDPVIDDQLSRNDVTAQRRDGGQARVTLDAGPMSTQAPPDGVGRYQTSASVNVLGDAMLGDQAGRRLLLGTIVGTRYPQITVDLDAAPGLATAIQAIVEGDRLTIANLPATITPDLASLIVQGWTETIASHRRRITFNCSPYEPYQLAEVAHATYGVIQSDVATLNEDLDVSETGVSIRFEGGPDWVDDGADWDIEVGGERMTVTSVGAISGTFPNRAVGLNVTRSVNGVVKTHASGGPIRFFHRSYIGL